MLLYLFLKYLVGGYIYLMTYRIMKFITLLIVIIVQIFLLQILLVHYPPNKQNLTYT